MRTIKELSKLTGIPYQTLLNWNSYPISDYRYKLLTLLRKLDRSILISEYGDPTKDTKGAKNEPEW